MPKVLLVDDEPSILSVLTTLLKAEGYEVHPVQDGRKAAERIKAEQFDLMLSDIRMTPVSGMDLLHLAHEVQPGMIVVMVTAFGSVETAVDAMKMGAYDYVTKPFKIAELLITVARALEYRRALSENVDLKAQTVKTRRFDRLVAESPAMQNVCQMIEHVSPTDTTVLIRGEKGVGKELAAQTIHEQSTRKAKEFISLDCSSVEENTLEAEMFGLASDPSGTTDGAELAGVFERAAGGTVYLGEIGAAPLSVQEQILRMFQEKEVVRVGANKGIPVSARVLVGTSQDLRALIKEGKFREDLLQRLSVIPLDIKPLRERPEDVLPLIYHILQSEAGKGTAPTIEMDARDAMTRYPWPRNADEMVEVVKYALAAAREGKIGLAQLPPAIAAAAAKDGLGQGASGQAAPVADDYKGKSLRTFLKSREKEYLQRVLEYTQGDKGKAAKALKISLATLYRKLPESDTETPPGTPPPQT